MRFAHGAPRNTAQRKNSPARRLDAANTLIEILMHKDPKARVILGLSREAAVAGDQGPGGTIKLGIDVAGLGQQVGLGEEQVQAVLDRVMRLGIVKTDASGITITDVGRLHEFLEFLEMQEKFGSP